MQVSHVSRQKYNPWTKIVLGVITSLLIASAVTFANNGDFNTKETAVVITVTMSICQWQFILQIIGEMTDILGIECFVTMQT